MMRNLDEPFTLYGLIAQSIETTPDRSRVTLRLNPLARFSDGSPITSDDVRFTFELLKAKGRPQFRGAYGQVKALLTPDAHTVVYDLTGVGDRELPLILVLMPVLSKAHTDVEHFNDATLTPPVASGPYVVEKVEPGQRLTLRRDPTSWGKDLPVSRGLYNFDEIRVEYYRDANAMHEAFKAGLLDYREETNPTRWMNGYDFPAIHDGRVIKASLPLGGPKGMQGFAFNTRRAIFADPRVREALGYMFDFEWINANLFGGLYRRTRSFFDESDLGSTGKPADARERALLARWPGAARDDILEGRWAPPKSDGSGRDRDMARHAILAMHGRVDGLIMMAPQLSEDRLAALLPRLTALDVWTAQSAEEVVRAYAEETGAKLGAVAQPLRAAATGRSTSPGVFDVLETLGREESLGRIGDQA